MPNIKQLEKEVNKKNKSIEENKKTINELKKETNILKEKLKKYTSHYVIEMRKALSTAILAAFGFLMALSWREYINEVIVNSVISLSPVQSQLIVALIVTIISVFGIIFVTRFLSVQN